MSTLDTKALALDKLGDYMGALKIYNDMFKYNENNSDLLNNIGISFYHNGNYSDGLLAHNAAIFVNKTNEFPYYNRALDLEALGDKQDALKNLDIAIKLNPTDKFAIKERQSLVIGGMR